jgi:hypothetical protein
MNLIGIILDIDNRHYLTELKSTVISFLGGLDYDDRAYVFSEDAVEVPRFKNEAIVGIPSMKVEEFRLDTAIKQTYYVMAGDLNEEEYDKYIIVITDRFDSKRVNSVERILTLPERSSVPTKFIFYNLTGEIITLEGADVYHCNTPADIKL